MTSCPEVGQLVVVRKRPFVVTEIVPSAPGLAPDGGHPSHLIKLSSVEDDGIGEELEVIWEIEPGTTVKEKSTLPEPSSFDHPKRLQAFLDAVRWGAVPKLMTAPSNLRSAAALKWMNTNSILWSGRSPCPASIF